MELTFDYTCCNLFSSFRAEARTSVASGKVSLQTPTPHPTRSTGTGTGEGALSPVLWSDAPPMMSPAVYPGTYTHFARRISRGSILPVLSRRKDQDGGGV